MKRKIMVCITRQKTCERLIRMGKEIADHSKGELSVVHVAKIGTNFLDNPHEGEALEYLFQISKHAGADLTVLRSDNVVNTLVKFAKENNISVLIVGESPSIQNKNNIIHQLRRRLPNVEIIVSSPETDRYSKMNLRQYIPLNGTV